MVIGPSGAAMFNTIFCRPGTKVIDIESERDWIWTHTGIFGSCELRYCIFLGQPDPTDTRPVHRRWTVDIDALVDRIVSFSAA
jgi:capsular polysaccharide biosynthesis protein